MTAYYPLLGTLYDRLLRHVVEQVLVIPDISEDDSKKLHELGMALLALPHDLLFTADEGKVRYSETPMPLRQRLGLIDKSGWHRVCTSMSHIGERRVNVLRSLILACMPLWSGGGRVPIGPGIGLLTPSLIKRRARQPRLFFCPLHRRSYRMWSRGPRRRQPVSCHCYLVPFPPPPPCPHPSSINRHHHKRCIKHLHHQKRNIHLLPQNFKGKGNNGKGYCMEI